MSLLRLVQHSAGPGRFTVEATLEGSGSTGPLRVSNEFAFELTAGDGERLRWYLEDFLQQPGKVEGQIAARIEARLHEIGEQLFDAVFDSPQGQRLWGRLEDGLADSRIEVRTDVAGATAVPWELLREPRTGAFLALRGRSFVRVPSETAIPARLPEAGEGPVRILLVICRPERGDDVPFRSVATRLIKGLKAADRERLQLDVLRPPTYARLAQVLREAKDRREPYHVVHFDGHGAYLDVPQPHDGLAEGLRRFLRGILPVALSTPASLLLNTARQGKHGYLLFENPSIEENVQLVDGPALGRLLVEAGVPVLVLNACRSAHAEPAAAPRTDQPAGADQGPSAPDEKREQALGSLAHEVIDQGVAGVLAMRYNVYVVTAAQLVADLYAALVAGHGFGEAVSAARKQLDASPLRTIAYEPVRLEDWSVPVVYEAAPIRLFPAHQAAPRIRIDVAAGTTASADTAIGLPPEPDAGFFGRDETLLALDRAFDRDHLVLLHAYAGSGKTATAAEFARWYQLTGGVKGPVIFTSFEHHYPLASVLATLSQVFAPLLERENWQALDHQRRRAVALQLLAQVPVLWIWDNVEPVTGFPAGSDTPWSGAEQDELVGFLRDTRGTKAKFLLTSRRDEQAWLDDLPTRIGVPSMPMQERVELAKALMAKRGRELSEVGLWRPLLEFTQGNPLTLTVVLGQALRDGLADEGAIAAYVDRLRAGEAHFEDEREQGRARSLGASLQYGFERGFEETDRRRLAVLALFQGFVNVAALQIMGADEAEWCLPELRGITREGGIALLDRAAEVGLLRAHGGGYYGVHPALPWFFKGLFDRHFPGDRARDAERAYVEAMGAMGNFYHDQFRAGNRDVIGALEAEEANLLHAFSLARRREWWGPVTSAMQGLRNLYDLTGRRAEWARLVEAVVPDFVDPASDGPLPAREEEWSLVTDYRVRLAQEARDWERAERLQTHGVEWVRGQARALLERDPASLDAAERNRVRSLAASVHELGQIQRKRGEVRCVESYRESLSLAERIGDRPGAATAAFNLGHAYMDLQALRDLDEAERWYRRSLELNADSDRLGRGGCYAQLGAVAYARFEDAQRAERPQEELLRHLNAAASATHQGLDLLPANAVDDLAVTHNQLGIIYAWIDLDRSLHHSRQSIAYQDRAGNRFRAAHAQFNVAIGLASAGRFDDALDYARGALQNFEHYGDRAATEIQKTQALIAQIEDLRRQQGT